MGKPRSRYVVWAALAAPLLVMLFAYGSGAVFYGEFIHWSGHWSTRLLMLALAVTPLRLLWPRQQWSQWLVRQRRAIGVAAFAYAAAHTVVYLLRLADLRRIASEMLEPGMWTAWVSLLIFILLAATSNDRSVRSLGRHWKALHRWVYAAAALVFAHWLLVAFDRTAGLVHLLVLGALFVLRAFLGLRRRG